MKILYFSGTGNSYATAKLIAGREGMLFNMANSVVETISDEYVGIVLPCYCNDIPDKAREFLSKVKIESQYIFAIVTCGASAGNCFVSVSNILKEKGLQLSYRKALVLPDSCIIFATKTEKAKKLLASHKEKVIHITKELSEKVTMTQLKDKKTPSTGTKMLWKLFDSVYKINDKKTNGRCCSCGKCVGYCPVRNISMKDGKVIFGTACQNCFACIQRCDKMAIQFGKIQVSNPTRYYHPILTEEN
ncbi:MAG TPA: EFR1 family ferrodoxin [Clostridia bacterium]|nr:EFR1 family ferrodoxin [Clostridia bacterium]